MCRVQTESKLNLAWSPKHQGPNQSLSVFFTQRRSDPHVSKCGLKEQIETRL